MIRTADTDRVRFSAVTSTRALREGISGTAVQRELGVTVELQRLRVVRGVADLWLEQRIGEWIAAYRVIAAQGRPWIGEIRIFPADTIFERERPKGEWVSGTLAGVRATVPAGGVTARILAEVKPRRWRRIAEQVIRVLYRTRGRSHPLLRPFTPYGPKRVRSPRGRKALPAEFYRAIAAEFDAARRAGLPPVKTLMKKRHAQESCVRGWIHRARRDGFLERPVLQEMASGR